MRDELDGRLWDAHHEQFGQWVDGAIASLRAGLQRLPQWDGTTQQLLAFVISFLITGLTFNATA